MSAPTLYRPETYEPVRFNDIPVMHDGNWYQSYFEPWNFKKVYIPAGKNTVTFGDRGSCTPETCADLDAKTLQTYWREYRNVFDGMVRRPRSDGSGHDVYFFQDPVNEDNSCRGDTSVLPMTFNRQEAVTLDVWASLRTLNFCKAAPTFEHPSLSENVYKVNLTDKAAYQKAVTGLDRLIAALEWRETYSEGDNPYNPSELPLEISLYKAEALRDYLRGRERDKQMWTILKWTGTVFGVLSVGFFFELTASLARGCIKKASSWQGLAFGALLLATGLVVRSRLPWLWPVATRLMPAFIKI